MLDRHPQVLVHYEHNQIPPSLECISTVGGHDPTLFLDPGYASVNESSEDGTTVIPEPRLERLDGFNSEVYCGIDMSWYLTRGTPVDDPAIQ